MPPHDLKFIFAEVNGDKLTWRVNSRTGEMKPESYDFSSVGKHISTKAVGTNYRNDITNEYKHPDGKRFLMRRPKFLGL